MFQTLLISDGKAFRVTFTGYQMTSKIPGNKKSYKEMKVQSSSCMIEKPQSVRTLIAFYRAS